MHLSKITFILFFFFRLLEILGALLPPPVYIYSTAPDTVRLILFSRRCMSKYVIDGLRLQYLVQNRRQRDGRERRKR